jgi:NAD(P)-dependent dehydrogenase (short-subunit alcohol dehydrogenase family)
MHTVHSRDLPPLPASIAGTFIRNQFFTTIPLPTQDLYPDVAGKCAIVTGSNTGLGFEAARQLLSLGLSHLVMGVRSLKNGQAAADRLIHHAKDRSKVKIDVWHLDMESYDSIQAFATQCSEKLPQRVDIAILNAGLAHTKFSTLPSTGHEPTVQVNHISTSLLAMLLLPVLAHNNKDNVSPARLTIVTSLTAHSCTFPMESQRPLLKAFDKPENFVGDRYGMSKMLNQLFIARLAARYVDPQRVMITMVDPGLTRGTGLFRHITNSPILIALSKSVMRIVGRPVERGAATYLDAVLGNYGEGSHGSLLMNCNVAPYCHWFYEDADGSKGYSDAIWHETMEELRFAGVEEILNITR